jgi:hypothetical protein
MNGSKEGGYRRLIEVANERRTYLRVRADAGGIVIGGADDHRRP